MALTVKLSDNIIMPMLSFGTYRITGEKLTRTVDAALRNGYRSFDTAQAYKNEADLGNALTDLLKKYEREKHFKRDELFLTTKIMPKEEKDVSTLVKESLERLKTPYLNMLLLHYPMYVDMETEDGLIADNAALWAADSDKNTKRLNDEWRISVWHAMEDVRKRGLVRSIGVANFEYRHLEQVPRYCHVTPAVNQIELNPHNQHPDIQRACKRLGIHLQAYAPLGRQQPALMSTPTLLNIAAKHHCSVPQLMIAWALHKGIGVVPKSDNPMRIESNMGATKIKLGADSVDLIDEVDEGKAYTKIAPWHVK